MVKSCALVVFIQFQILFYYFMNLAWEVVDYFSDTFVNIVLLGVFEISQVSHTGHEIGVKQIHYFKLQTLFFDFIHGLEDEFVAIQRSGRECLKFLTKCLSLDFLHFSYT